MNATDPIRFYNRHSGRMETESIYGEGFLKWAYGNPLGRCTVEVLVKRMLFSRWYGWWMDRPQTARKVKPFVRTFELDPEEFDKDLDAFVSFNDFFSRRLKPEARPVDTGTDSVVFPADGRHLGFQDLSRLDRVFVKGQSFELDALLGDTRLAEQYRHGSAVLSRLCPTDYHRFHFSVDGQVGKPKGIHGALYSVNPMALRQNLSYLWQNKRVLTRVQTEHCGQVLILEIGATNVGSICQTFSPESKVRRGEEKGYFRFGGSATMVFFEPDRVRLADDLLEHAASSTEVYARMGHVMATIQS